MLLQKPTIISSVFVVSLGTATAELDLNRNGFSELWELQYPEAIEPDGDLDADGFSNAAEAVAGTNPGDASSFLELEVVGVNPSSATVQWQGVEGKAYRIEKYSEGGWLEVVNFLPRPFPSQRSAVILSENPTSELLRVIAFDLDLDQDGLSAWEESQLGWSDNRGQSSGDPDRLDYAAAIRSLEDPGGVTLANGRDLGRRLPSREEASRFLMQASFGPTKDEIDKVTAIGLTGWMDEQMAMSPSLSRQTMWLNGANYSATLWKDAWWKLSLGSPDQLRQRIAYALSQIFVVGFQGGSWVGDNPLVQASYYDHLIQRSSGTYRELLNDVTYSPVMGFYLSHLRNRKSDPETGRFPDENFAREIMQLFSVGLWELHPDGTRKIDQNGLNIPTYDNATITEMAKVFTGMSFSRNGINSSLVDFFSGVSGNAYLYPMKVFELEHEPGLKTLIGGVVLNDTANGGEALTGDEEVQATLDTLASHENTAPFISHLLIQRLTSSNPKPEYVQRVSEAWHLRGGAESGSFKRVMEAILLDQEARSQDDPDRGKVREPVIRVAHLLRVFDYRNSRQTYPFRAKFLQGVLGQHPMLSESVFNFYLPAFSPPGEMAELGWVSPEMQIADASQLIDSDNLLKSMVESGYGGLTPDFSQELALAGNTEVLLDHLVGLLCSRDIAAETRAVITAAVEAQGDARSKVNTAVHLLVGSPEAATLR